MLVKIISGASDSLPIYDPTIPFFSGKISPRLLTHHSIPMLKLRDEIRVLSEELQSTRASFAWRGAMKLHSFIERMVPPGTRRGRWYYKT